MLRQAENPGSTRIPSKTDDENDDDTTTECTCPRVHLLLGRISLLGTFSTYPCGSTDSKFGSCKFCRLLFKFVLKIFYGSIVVENVELVPKTGQPW